KGDRLLEIAAGMALVAAHLDMLAQQRKLRPRVVKALAYRCRGHALPSAGVVARLAGAGKSAAVRVAVAVGAGAERKPHVLRLAVCARQVALLAGHLLMQAGKRIARAAVIKAAQRPRKNLPVIEPVALLAVLSQTALVLVFMAGHA